MKSEILKHLKHVEAKLKLLQESKDTGHDRNCTAETEEPEHWTNTLGCCRALKIASRATWDMIREEEVEKTNGRLPEDWKWNYRWRKTMRKANEERFN